MIRIVSLYLFILLLVSACQTRVTLPESTVRQLKEKYSDTTLRFFGRQAFGAEAEGIPKLIYRVESNPVKLLLIDVEKIDRRPEARRHPTIRQYIDSVMLFFNGVSRHVKFEYTSSFAEADAIIMYSKHAKATQILPVHKLFTNRLSKEICYMKGSYNPKPIIYHELFHMFSGVGRNCFHLYPSILSGFSFDENHTRFYAIDSAFVDIMLNFDIPPGLTLEQYEKQLGIQCGTREEAMNNDRVYYEENLKKILGDSMIIFTRKP